MGKDSTHLAYRVIDTVFRDIQNITKYITRKLRELEDFDFDFDGDAAVDAVFRHLRNEY